MRLPTAMYRLVSSPGFRRQAQAGQVLPQLARRRLGRRRQQDLAKVPAVGALRAMFSAKALRPWPLSSTFFQDAPADLQVNGVSVRRPNSLRGVLNL